MSPHRRLVALFFLLLTFTVGLAVLAGSGTVTKDNIASRLFLIGDQEEYDDAIFDGIWENVPPAFNNQYTRRRQTGETGEWGRTNTNTTKTTTTPAMMIRIAIITTASLDPDYPSYYKQLFESKSNERYQIETEWIPITMDTPENSKNATVVQMLNRVNMVFFSGGDQSRLIKCFCVKKHENDHCVDSPFLARLRQLYHAGSVLIVGTSAGTAVQASKPAMITGGESWEALVYGPFENKCPDKIRYALTYNPKGGFNMFTLGLIDTHLSERGRQGRIMRLASHVGSRLAFGMDEHGALYIESHRLPDDEDIEIAHLKIYGTTGVHMFNLTEHQHSFDGPYWRASMIQDSYFTHGDSLMITMNHRTGASAKQVRFAPWKTLLWGREEPKSPYPSKDIFSSPDANYEEKRRFPREFTNTAQDLVNSKYGNKTVSTTFENNPMYLVGMQRIDFGPYRTRAVQGYDTARKRSYISYDHILVDMQKWEDD